MGGTAIHRLALFALVAAVLMLPAFLFGPGDSHSAAYNYIWTSQFGSEMAQGNLYPRWLPDSFEERVRIWQESVGAWISLLSVLLTAGFVLRRRPCTAISHLSKFPAYSPLPATLVRPNRGGES